MGKFKESEKPIQANFKTNTPYYYDGARVDGIFTNKEYPFCIPREYANENLFSEIRKSAVKFIYPE